MNLRISYTLIPLLGILFAVAPPCSSQTITAKETEQSARFQQEKSKEPAFVADNELLVVWSTTSRSSQVQALAQSVPRDLQSVTYPSESDTPHISVIKLDSQANQEQVMEQLTSNPAVRYVEPNKTIHLTDITNDPLYSEQWALPMLHVPESWAKLTPSKKTVKVAVLDSGIDLNHPDLLNHILPGKDYVDQDSSPLDLHGHGTHVSGIIAASANNSLGIAGLSGTADVEIIPLKILNSEGEGKESDEIQAIYDAVEMGVDVINLSIGSAINSQAEHDAIRYAVDHNVVVVAASGNEYSSSVDYPAAYSEAVAVAATDSSDKVAHFSNYGSAIDLAAPGVDIVSTVPNSLYRTNYETFSGTSMAAPHVSALAAILKTQAPQLTNKEIEQIIKDTAVDIGTPGKDHYSGYGRIDFLAAIQKVTETAGTDPGSFSYTLAQLNTDPAMFHRLLLTNASSEIQVRDANGVQYTWMDLVGEPKKLSSVLKQNPKQVTLSFPHGSQN